MTAKIFCVAKLAVPCTFHRLVYWGENKLMLGVCKVNTENCMAADLRRSIVTKGKPFASINTSQVPRTFSGSLLRVISGDIALALNLQSTFQPLLLKTVLQMY